MIELGAYPNTSWDKDEFYESFEKKYSKLDKDTLIKLRELLINDPNSFYHIHGYDFDKKLTVERELLAKEVTK